MKVGFRD